MKYVDFGKTGMTVSALTLGTWGMGGAGWDVYGEEQKADTVKAALEQGINFIDTAPAYNNGEAERFLGRTLKQLGARSEVYLATKVGNFFTKEKTYVHDSSYDKILQQCDDSLLNLKTDHIDLMLIHWPDPNTPFEETMDAMNRMKKEGKVLHVGVSNFSIEQMKEIRKYGDLEAYQPQYSMVYRSSEDIIRWAAQEGMGIMTYGSLGGGILTGRYRTFHEYPAGDNRNRFYKHFHEPMFSKVMKLLEVMDEVSARNGGIPLSDLALLWNCSKPFVSTCIVGAQKRERIEENARCFDHVLSPEDMQLLDVAIEKLQ